MANGTIGTRTARGGGAVDVSNVTTRYAPGPIGVGAHGPTGQPPTVPVYGCSLQELGNRARGRPREPGDAAAGMKPTDSAPRGHRPNIFPPSHHADAPVAPRVPLMGSTPQSDSR